MQPLAVPHLHQSFCIKDWCKHQLKITLLLLGIDYSNGDHRNDKMLHKSCTSISGNERASARARRDETDRIEEQELHKMTLLPKET